MILGDDILKKDLFAKIDAEIKERLEVNPNAFSEQDFRKFTQAFYATISSEELTTYKRSDLFHCAYSLYKFAKERTEDIKIRIFNPTIENDGWNIRRTVIEIVMTDSPFQVDSLLTEFNRRKLNTFTLSYPLIPIQRINGKASLLYASNPDQHGVVLESVMQFTINYLQESTHEELKNNLYSILKDVICATSDWLLMRQRMEDIRAQLAHNAPTTTDENLLHECESFLQWLYEGNFTLLGYRYTSYTKKSGKTQLVVDENSALGLLRNSKLEVFGEVTDTLANAIVSSMMQTPWLIRVIKSSHYSHIHRLAPMDTVAIKTFDKNGNLSGEHLFLGLFTIAAYKQSIFQIPLLRRRGKLVLEQSHVSQKSYAYKSLYKVLENFPRDELFQTPVDLLYETAGGMAHIIDRAIHGIFIRPDSFERGVSAIVLIPYHQYSAGKLESQMGNALANYFSGRVVFTHPYIGHNDTPLVLIHYYILVDGAIPTYDIRALKSLIQRVSEPWEDVFKNVLIEKFDREKAYALNNKYIFSTPYQEAITPDCAINDIENFETCKDNINVSLYKKEQDHHYGLRIYYRHATNISPSRTVPLLENLGFQVLQETPFNLQINEESACLYDFLLKPLHKEIIDVESIQESFRQVFLHVWLGTAENDSYNQLALAGLNLHDIIIIRAFARYLGQLSVPFSQEYISSLITNHIDLASQIASYFKMRFRLPKANEENLLKLEENIKENLNKIQNNDADRILRSLFQICQSTLRTTFFQGDKPYLAFKIDSHSVQEIPKPVPYREIFVYSPDFEGIHLRFAPISRGGLRWSDRPQDFRTEILGLVKTQQVKNAVIVPMGAKGGFILKKILTDRDALFEEGIRCYQLFIQALLDLTDNIVQGHIVNPNNVLRYDQDDPYLVVAADKGTATFSDYANAISIKNNFWLGDAFASGGSAGYDHKKMGITARGAMICVERHFYELGRNIYKDDFSVVGIGDMSGDVFGNGMIVSPHIRLIAAFNHMHIFIDPNPDPIKSLEERKRLFYLPRSTWKNYSEKLISKGGGVFERNAKTIPVSPEMQKIFHITKNEIKPNDLIRHILLTQYDLLWLGGIGTYIKHSEESHTDVKDNANNAIRVDAKDLKCRVIGEGANLGMTQRARIEFSAKGGLCHTDAIDNSAGVSCSDHEVNIKILLNPLVQAGKLTEENRNVLLESITDDIATLVLADNKHQAQILSFLYAYSLQDLDKYQAFIQYMENEQLLDRNLESLPSDDELGERAQKGIGLFRPELAVLLAYSKNTMYKMILETDIPELPTVQHMLFDYFPKKLVELYAQYIANHQLKREIIATTLVNSIVNRTGPAFITSMFTDTNHHLHSIICAYLVVTEVFSLSELFKSIENLQEKITAETQVSLFYEIGRTIKRMTRWFLNNENMSQPLEILISTYKEGVQTLHQNYETFLDKQELATLNERINRFLLPGVPEEIAKTINLLKIISMSCDVIRLAAVRNTNTLHVARIYSAVGERFHFNALRKALGALPYTTSWARRCAHNLIEELWNLQFQLSNQALENGNESNLDKWIQENKERVEQMDKLFVSKKTNPSSYTLTIITVFTQELNRLIHTI